MARNSTHDHWMTLDELANGGDPYDPAEVVEANGEPAVPRRCRDCNRPAYYDMATDTYEHAERPADGCFLIPASVRPADPSHPLMGETL